MPKRDQRKSPYSRSEKKYGKWEKEGRGTGHGPDYIPGLYINEVPSSVGNRKHSIPGIKAKGRLVQLMSDLEYSVFLFFDLAKQVIDIREQFPLEREVTLSIAEKLKIQHPSVTDANTKEEIAHWMTTDLLIDYYDSQGKPQQLAVYIKYAKDLKGKNLEKLIIECVYWALEGARFCIIVNESIPKEITENLDFITPFYESPINIKELHQNIEQIENLLIHRIKNEYLTINKLCSKLDKTEEFKPGCSLSIFYYMVATRKIDLPLKRFSIGPNTHSSEIRKYLI